MHACVLCLVLALAADKPSEDVAMPKVVDSRLKIELFAAEPDIMTPTGLAVDSAGRVLVVESHTHFRPEGYQGPPADRIRMFVDADGDGRAERVTNFFEGTKWTMNLGIHPDGSVYVATRSEVFRLRDTDGDGRADERTPIARLETTGDYPHNGLSGFAFDFAGNVYFGLGENLGRAFKLIGTDGSVVSELEGGQIYCCRADGTQLRQVAIGYWNPFHVAFDAFGRLFAVDNDPDSLPPCRLMHIVEGGNYGYRYRNGRKGVHPFTAWNGELPGTLPMVAGTGEAPSGVLAYESDQLPADYLGDLLSTSWGDHRIERFHLEPRGASFRAVGAPIITGDENFRPVGIAMAPDGSLFVSDWVSKSYNVHGQGRVWHVTAKDKKPAARPADPIAAMHSADRAAREAAARKLATDAKAGRSQLEQMALTDSSTRVRALAVAALAVAGDTKAARTAALDDPAVDVRTAAIRASVLSTSATFSVDEQLRLIAADQPAEVRAEAMRLAVGAGEAREKAPSGSSPQPADPRLLAVLWQAVSDADAFIAEAAREGLASLHAVTADVVASKADPSQRLAGLLILREKHDPAGRKMLARFLKDPDTAVRFAAIQWVGEERLTDLRGPLVDALSAGPATARLFGGYLAALERLDGVVRESSNEWAGEQYMIRALDDPRSPTEVRRFSLRMLRPDHPALTAARLKEYLKSDDMQLRLEAVRTIRDGNLSERGALLAEIAADAGNPTALRAEAAVGLSPEDPAARRLLVELAQGNVPALRDESLRSLRGAALNADEKAALQTVGKADDRAAELVRRILEPAAVDRAAAPDDLAGWLERLDPDGRPVGGDPRAGERIFFHRKSAGCSNCHQIGGRGAKVGPELTATTGKLARGRLIESIVRPGKEIAPQFATWQVVTTSGKTMTGVLVKEEATGEQTYADSKGELVRFATGEIESRRPQSTSIMPDGLARQLTLQEFRDLLAFLQAPSGSEQ